MTSTSLTTKNDALCLQTLLLYQAEPTSVGCRGVNASISDMQAYGTSKLMTIMSNSEIVRRLQGSRVDSFLCQPGMTSTPVYKKTDKSQVMANVLDAAQKVMGQTEERGAVPTLYAATAPELAGMMWAHLNAANSALYMIWVQAKAANSVFSMMCAMQAMTPELQAVANNKACSHRLPGRCMTWARSTGLIHKGPCMFIMCFRRGVS